MNRWNGVWRRWGAPRIGAYAACLALLVALVGGAIIPARGGAATPAQQGGLLTHAAAAAGPSAGAAPNPRVLRSRSVNVNLGMLASGSGAVQLNLFPDMTVTAMRESSTPTSTGRGSVWVGRVDGVNNSRVTLVAEDGVLSGNVNVAGANYEIRYAGGAHLIRQVAQGLYPPDKPAVPVRAPTGPSAAASARTPTAAADDGSI